jgi:thiamine-phosphate pyrophosphorylase
LAEAAVAQGADYVAFGRFFASRTKPLASPAQLETLTAARLRLPVPIVAIGGITPKNAPSLLAAGAGVMAVVDAVCGQDDPEGAARAFQNLFSSSRL